MGSNFRSLVVSLGLTIATILLASANTNAQECQCVEECPTPGYTKCWEGWTSTNMVVMNIYIPVIQTYCDVEVRYCCRTRSVVSAQCQSFVTGPLGASCETAITCIKIPKS